MTHIACQRHRFAIPDDIHYLNCGYMSPLGHDVVAAITAGANSKASPWTYKPADFFSVCEDFRNRVAGITAVPADSIAIVPSASYGLAIAARNLPLARGQAIVVLADQFPSNLYIWRERAAETGAHIVTVQRDPASAWTDAVLDAIGPDTAIVAVPHCHWADGRIVDLEAVSAKCRDHSAALVLDLTQSLGAMPIDFAAIRPAFAVTAHYKWMMGPYGTGHLYVDPAYHDGQPIEQNWINRAGADDFARLVDYRDDFQPGARRFDMGEKANPPLLGGASAGIDLLMEFGVEAIAATLGTKTEAIATAVRHLDLDTAPIGIRAPHFLSLGFPKGVPTGLTEQLAAQNVFVSQRNQSLRVTPHLYNTPEDAEALIDVLQTALT
jgi:selenocysteine lyase/cysteine desulfurase